MSLVVYLGAAFAAWLAFARSPQRALLGAWLPLLLLVPDGFRAITPGLPDPNFNQAAILPVLAAALIREGRHYRFALTDLLVLAFAVLVGLSEYLASGYSDAQNLMFGTIASVAAPYLCARLLLDSPAMDEALARRLVLVLAGLAVIGLYEAKFGWNPFFGIIGVLFPGQGTGWVTTFRHGIARVAGPYSHAILAGVMMVIAYRLQRWLQSRQAWAVAPTWWPALPGTIGGWLRGILLVGSLMTVARGPWLGGLLGGLIVMAGSHPKRGQLFLWGGLGALLLAVPAWLMLSAYMDVAPGAAMSASQESALYRKVLMDKYLAIAIDHAWLGWGLTKWPKVDGMVSVDNYFLLLSLMHGVLACAAFVALFLWVGVRLMRRSLADSLRPDSLHLSLLAILAAVFLSVGTVYLGEQVLPLLFLIFGWSEAALRRPSARPASQGGGGDAPAERPLATQRVTRVIH
jgi:hypothetical protein